MKKPDTSPSTPSPQEWRPHYWKKEHDTAWSRVREAFSRDWNQTKNDLTGTGTDLNQDVPDTLKQAAGTQPIPEKGQPNSDTKASWVEAEPGLRYGFGARQQYAKDHQAWDQTVEKKLAGEWDANKTGAPFAKVHHFVRAGWERHSKTPDPS